ncbi:MAG: hypothetical protein A2Y25_05790 [Candidatus Melainabacteria bacterium GWF2_37_15]|nr:MAG: hypothetical protein A2Y25_05790 [Candidatus Melainabacteria bacterium GWF2_37_15]
MVSAKYNKQKIEESFALAEKILRKVSLTTVKKVESRLQGDYKSIFHGNGLDFKEIREYTINDDVRNIDWNATARLGRPHVRVYEEERDHTIWLILDVSQSMEFGSKFTTKKDVMINFAALMGYLAYKKGDKTGAILFNQGIEDIIPPEKGIKQIYRIVTKLLDYKPAQKRTNEFNFSKLVKITGKKKTLFFISDFIFNDQSWQKPFGEMVLKNDAIAVRIIDPVEENLPDIGYINLYDPETGKALVINASDRKIAEKYRELVDEENKKTNEIFSILRLNPVKIYTNSDIAEVLINYRRQHCTASASNTPGL